MSAVTQNIEIYPNEAASFVYHFMDIDISGDTFTLYISDNTVGANAVITKVMDINAGDLTVDGVTYSGYWLKKDVLAAEMVDLDDTSFYWIERLKAGGTSPKRLFEGSIKRLQ